MSGLRERKKVKTRAAIQQHALRLFREQGYAATTVEQIAAAAEISPSTFFRYFPTKEDVVLHDDYDALIVEAFHAQPPDLTPLQAIQYAIRTVYSELPAEAMAQERERHAVINAVPELRARTLDSLIVGIRLLVTAVAARTGRREDDLAVRTFTGALMGVGLAAIFDENDDPAHHLALMDAGLSQLDAGLPL